MTFKELIDEFKRLNLDEDTRIVISFYDHNCYHCVSTLKNEHITRIDDDLVCFNLSNEE